MPSASRKAANSLEGSHPLSGDRTTISNKLSSDVKSGKSLTMMGEFTGTPSFASPEQAAGLELDGRADLYSLGIVAYYMLTGHLPFTGSDWFAIVCAHANDPVSPMTKFTHVPAELERIVLKCLEKKPDDRFPDAQSLGEALRKLTENICWTQKDARQWWSSVLDG